MFPGCPEHCNAEGTPSEYSFSEYCVPAVFDCSSKLSIKHKTSSLASFCRLA